MKIIKRLSNNSNHYNGVNGCKYITIHETGNTDKGANALMHSRYMNNGSKETWHYSVDSNYIYQHFDDNVQCWHAGTGRRTGNLHSIAIEMCVNSDGVYSKTIDNTVELVRYLMKKHNIPLSNVVQHNHWSGKNCPQQLRENRNGITWNMFKNLINRYNKIDKEVNDIDRLAKDVIAGKYGNGDERKRKLGSLYAPVQKRVNELSKHPVKHPIKSDKELAKEVIQGKHGTGEARKRSLGSRYKEVQKLVNKMM